jgi:hypothetical protein
MMRSQLSSLPTSLIPSWLVKFSEACGFRELHNPLNNSYSIAATTMLYNAVFVVGVVVGDTVGTAVGVAVGVAVGFGVGVAVGAVVGVAVGFAVGDGLGVTVGVPVE